MSNTLKQIFFIFVEQKDVANIQIKDLNNFNKNLKEIKKVKSDQIHKKKANLYSIEFINGTKYKNFVMIFKSENGKLLYTSDEIKFKNDIDNFLYDFKINEGTNMFQKVVTMGIYQNKEIEYIKLNKSEQFNFFINYLDDKYTKQIKPGNQKDNLITQTITIIGKEEKVSFALYLNIFKEIFRFKKISTLLRIFKIDKISFEEKVDPNKFSGMFKFNLKNPNYFDKFFEKKEDKLKKLCIKNYYLIVLLYFYHYEKDYMKELILPQEQILNCKGKQDLIGKIKNRAIQMKDLLKEHLDYCPNLPPEISNLFNKDKLSNIHSVSELQNFLDNKVKKLEEKMKIIFDKINVITIQPITIKSNNTQISKDDNIDNIITLFQSIIKIGHEKNKYIIIVDEEIWKRYVVLFVQNKTIDNIYKIKNIICYYNSKSNNYINNELLNLGRTMVKEKLLKNESVLKFFINYMKNNSQFHPYHCLFLADGIFINEASDEFFKMFKSYGMKEIFKNFFSQFFGNIFLKIDKVDDFILVFQLFPSNNNIKLEKNEIDTIIKCLWKIIEKEKNIENSQKFNEIIMNIIMIIVYNNYKYEEFLNQLNTKGIKKEIIKKFYLWIIQFYGETNKEFITYSINFISSDKTDNMEDTINILNQMKNNHEALFSYFNNKNIIQKAIKDADFKKSSITPNFKFLTLLVENLFFEDNLINALKTAGYYNLTISFVTEIINKCQNLDFNYNEALELQNINDKLEKKLNVICFNDYNKSNEILGILESTIENFIELKKNIELIEKYINIFFKKDKKINNHISLFNSKLMKCKVSEYEKCLTEYNSKYKEHLENAKKCSKLNQSVFFKNLYKYYEKENPKEADKYLLDESIKNYEELSDILDESNLNKISKETFNIILENIRDEKEIRKEMNILKKHFGEENKNTSHIEKNLLLLSQREFILYSISDILFFLEKLNVTSTEYSEKLKKINSSINTESSLVELIQVSNILSELDINIKQQHDSLKILRILHNKSNLLDFLLEKKEEDIRNLTEFVNENDNSFLKAGDIQLLMRCSEFIQELVEKKLTLNDQQFIEFLHELVKNEKYKNIEAYFQNSSDNFTAIKDLYSQNVDRSQFTKQKIKEIYTASKFEIKNNQKKIECTVSYGFDYDKYISFDEIIDLRDRSMLQKAESSENENDLQLIIKSYNNIINQIEILREDIEELINKGYPVDFFLKIFMLKDDVYIEIDKPKEIRTIIKEKNKGLLKDKFSIREISLVIREELDNLIQSQFKGYINKEVIRFIYGRQFNHLIKYIRLRLGDVNNFLKYFTNNKITKIPDFTYIRDDDYNIFEDMLNNCELFLNYILTENNLKIEDIYENNKIKRPGYEGLHLYYVKIDDMEKEIIEWYNLLTGNLSTAHTTLLCNDDTTIEEIIAFLFRAIYCNYYAFFTIINVEYLSLDIKNKIIEILNIFYIENKDKMKSCLNFIFNSKESEIYEQIRELGGKILKSNDFKNAKASIDNKNIKIYYSDASGVGKSTRIKNEILKDGKEYIYMPIGGEFTREEIIKRLLKIEFKNDKETAIHIDIMETKKKDLMKEFLFSLLINKCYKESENLFYLNDNVNIYIEIPFGFTDFFKEYKILNLFNNKVKLEKNKLDPLIINEELDSDIQVVCNYLNILDENENNISQNNIIIPGINNDIYDNNRGIMAKTLPQEKCEELIKKYFKEGSPAYYQIGSFISVLAHQLKYFSKNVYFDVQIMKENGKQRDLSVRVDFVKACIKITAYFTKDAYGRLLNSQEVNIALQEGNSDEKAINMLTDNKDIISYDKINPSLIFLNDDGQSMTIICTRYKENTVYIMGKLGSSTIKYGDIYTLMYNKAEIIVYWLFNSEKKEFHMLYLEKI